MDSKSDKEKIEYLEEYADDYSELEQQGKLDEFRALVEEGVAKEWEVALHIKGYACYGGNSLYECDWKESERLIKRLAKLTEDPYCYNTLGYIYYYGRCNDGVPEYDKAFQCFTIGHACGLFESTYKLADMFQGGKGTVVNNKAAVNLIVGIYEENLEIFCRGVSDCKFADVALRMGGLFEKGIGIEEDPAVAYEFYKKAQYAIDKRMASSDRYGDSKVQKHIEEAIERVKPLLPDDYRQKYIELETPEVIGDLLKNSMGLDITLKKVKGRYYLEAKGYGTEDEAPGRALVCFGQMDYCELCDTVGLFIQNPHITYGADELPAKAFVTGIQYDEDRENWLFMYRDQVMLSFSCDGFIFYPIDR